MQIDFSKFVVMNIQNTAIFTLMGRLNEFSPFGDRIRFQRRRLVLPGRGGVSSLRNVSVYSGRADFSSLRRGLVLLFGAGLLWLAPSTSAAQSPVTVAQHRIEAPIVLPVSIAADLSAVRDSARQFGSTHEADQHEADLHEADLHEADLEQADGHVHGVKCLTPVIMALSEGGDATDPRWHQLFEAISGLDAQSAEMVRNIVSGQQALEMLSSEIAQDLLQYVSPAGKFVIEYTLEGTTAVPAADLNQNGIPDYVERAAEYADFSHFALVDSLGFVEPRLNGAPIQIRFVAGSSYGFYNFGTQPNILFVHKDFEGFPSNRDPDGRQLGALKVTIAHELKHAIQFRTNGFVGDSGSVSWVELDATMTEEVVFPMVKDYLNYLNSSVSLFRGTQPAIPGAYDQATFGLFYHEYFGPTFWTSVWNRIRLSPRIRMFDAIALEVQSRGENPRREFLRNLAWHLASGSRSRPGVGFASAELYPTRTGGGLSFAEQQIPGVTAQVTLNANMVRFYEITPGSNWEGLSAVALLRENSALGAAILLFKRDGSLEFQFLDAVTTTGMDALVTATNWSDTDRVGLVLANMGASFARAQLAYGAAQDPLNETDVRLPGLFRLGDVHRDGELNLADAERYVTEFLAQNGTFATTGIELARRPAFDLTGNGTISPLDASLLLARLRGEPDPFPTDAAGDGWYFRFDDFRQQLTPQELSRTRSGSAAQNLALPIASSAATSSAAMSSAANHISTPGALISPESEITSTPTLATRFTVSDTPDNDTLSIYLELPDDVAIRGGYFNIRYDTSLVGLATVDILQTDEQGSSRIMLANDSPTPHYLLDWNETTAGSRVLVVAAEADLSGTFLRLQFQPKLDTLVEVRFQTVYLDEFPALTQTPMVETRVRPKEGVGIEQPPVLPEQTALIGNFPNPFNPTTTIVFRLSEPANTRVSIYDVTGRLVSTLHSGTLPAGEHQLRFNGRNLSSGVYIVRMESAGHVYTAKMLLVK